MSVEATLKRRLDKSFRLATILDSKLKRSLPKRPSHVFLKKDPILAVGIDGGMAKAGVSMAIVGTDVTSNDEDNREEIVEINDDYELRLIATECISTSNSEAPERRCQRLFRKIKGFIKVSPINVDIVCLEAFSQPRFSTSASRLGLATSALLCGALTKAKYWTTFRPHDTHPAIADLYGGESSKENTYEKMIDHLPEEKLPRHNNELSEGPAGHVVDATATIIATVASDSSTIYEGEVSGE